ncbi:hypothetical protein BLNAU_24979 [Blattamonas nauphoetae]|uniref:Protein kinase domain-containing protein n=1 Tax=Blattamonas nauphoetae TaxID=2049346 RepID=A0ABQ9WKW6_9EUKA|nr:hypothetical protein BLNAU_24979 [Blattamonas nauphoetae]
MERLVVLLMMEEVSSAKTRRSLAVQRILNHRPLIPITLCNTAQSTSNGGCVLFSVSDAEITVSHTLFSNARASNGGGFTHFNPTKYCTISTTFCVFKNCDATNGGGCRVNEASNSVSFSHCDFLECTGTNGGGLMISSCSGLVSVTDSYFEKCDALSGGAIFINNTASFKLDSLTFTACTGSKGKDLSVSLPPISVSASLALEGDEWVLTVSTREPIEGKLLVVLDNKPAEESNYEQPTSRSPPPIGRLFVLDFASGETSKSQSVPINEWSFLQYESNYSITVASLAGANITQSFSSILVTPNPRRIVEAACEIKDGDPTTGIISLRGRTLEEGHYMAQLKEVGDLPISVTFTELHTLPNSKTMISSTIEVSLLGEERKLEYGKEYEVEFVRKDGADSFMLLDPPRLFMLVPDPTRLTGASTGEYRNDKDPSIVSIPLTGTEIPIGSYEMNVSLGDGSLEEITLNVTFSSKESGTATAVVFDAENGEVDLLFDSEYSIDSLWNENGSVWIPSPLSFFVPSPPIVESVESATLDGNKSSLVVILFGSGFVPGPDKAILFDGSTEISSKSDVSVTNSTHTQVTFSAGWTQTRSKVAYGQSYLLKSVSSSSKSFLVRPSIMVNVPKAPCVTGISCVIDASLTHFVVTFTGQDLPLSGLYSAHLQGSLNFSVTFADRVGTSGLIPGNVTNSLSFGRSYTLSNVSYGSDKIILNATSFSTPAGPALSNVSCSLDSSNFAFVDLSLSGSRLPSSSDYYLIVMEGGKYTQMIVPVLFTSLTDGKGRVEVFNKANTLKYGQSYSVHSLIFGSLSIYPSPSITFDVPNPPRLTAVEELILIHNDGQSTISISLTGTEIPVGSYEMNVSLVEGESSEEITLNVSFSSKESGTATAVVFDAEDGKVDLLFDSEYSIDSLWKIGSSIWIPSSLSFVVPSSPGIVESFLSASLNNEKTIVTLTFCGSDFVSGPTHVVLLDGSNEVKSNADVSVLDRIHFTVTFAAGWTQSPSTVAYGQTYSLKSVSSSSSSFLVRPSISVTIPKAPCVTRIECDIDTSLAHFVVKLSGSGLPRWGTCTARLAETLFSFSVIFTNEVGWSDPIEGNASNGLLFETEYTLSSLSQGTDQILLNATSFSTPAGPTLSDVTCSLDSSDFNFVDLTLTGSGMPSSTEYELIVADSEDSTQLTLDVSFTTPTDGFGRIEVNRKTNTLKFGRSYSVVALILGSMSISPSQPITFDLAEPPRLVGVGNGVFPDPLDQSTFSIPLSGSGIPVGVYWMNVSLVEGESSEAITLFASFSSTESGTATALVFDADNGEVDLLFDSEYSIDSLWKIGSSIWIPSSLSFVVPSSPGIVESFLSASLNDAKTIVTLTFCGSDFVSGPTHAVLLDGSNEVTSYGNQSVINSTHFTVSVAAGWTRSPSTVAYGQTYSLKSVSSSSSSFLVRSSISVKIPKAPCVTKIECDIDTSLTHFTMTFTGQNLPLSGLYTALLSLSASFEVTFSEHVGKTGLIEGNATNGLLFGTEYTLSSLSQGTDQIILNTTSFLTPAGPTLSDVTCSLDSSDFNFVDLTLTGSGMPSSTEYELIVADSEDSTQLTLDVSFTTPSEGSGKVEVYHKENTLKYGQSYSVVSLFLGSLSISLPSQSIVFDVPNPPRLTAVEELIVIHNDGQSTLSIALTGTEIPVGSYEMNVSLVEDGSSEEITLNVSFSSKEWDSNSSYFVSGPTHVVLLDGSNEVTSNVDLSVRNETNFTVTFAAGWTQSPSTVAYGQTYSLKSISSSFLVRSSISVKIPKAPCVTKIECDIDTSLTHFVVKFTGQDLPLSGTYTARLMSSSASFEVTFLEGVGTSDPIEGNATNGLSFLTSYTLSSVTSDTDHLLLNATSFLTPAGPTLSDVTCSLDSSDFNFVDLTLTGSGMPSSTEYELIVADSEDSTQLTLDVSFTTPSEGSGKVEVYHKENTLKYGRSYSVVSLFLGSLSISIPDSVTFRTPSAPIRIEGATADLLDDGTTVMITLRGVKLGEGSWMITVPTTPPQTVPGQLGEDGVVTFSLTADDSDASKLIFGLKYKIDTVTLNSTAVLVNDDVFFTVPRTALVSSGSFVFVNTLHTSCKLVLEGSHFPLLGEYNVTLEPAFWTVVSFSSESLGESSEIEIGRSEGLKYSQQFTISLIVRTDDANDVIKSDQSIVLKTGSQPASAVFLVDSSGSSSPFCGDLARPCSSMDVGLSILSKVGIVQCEMKIVEKATQNKQHMVESGSVLSMSASSTISAELEIGASAWMASNSGLFVVSSARLEFHEIAVSIRRQEESFVLVRSLDPSSSSNVDTSDSPSSLCDWSTGLFVLSNCSTSIKLTEMTHLPQGAMNMKGGSVTIEAGIFHDNTPNDALFPSARRNMRCSENGKVEVGSLSSGDGSTDKHPHLWLSSSDCILSGEDVNINAPLFVPTLSSDSTSSWNKKKEQFEVTILGTMLIPCGLFLEVFELKDSSEGKSYPIDLAQQSFVSFTETNMTFTIARSSLSELDGSAEWRGRLVYGSNEKTRNSFQMQRDSSGRLSQTVKENMKWWLPLVIVLSVTALFDIALLIFLVRRRKQKENVKKQQTAEANELDLDIEVLKMEDTSIATTDRVHASSFESPTQRDSIATGQKETKRPPESEEGEEDTKKEERVMACGLDGKEVAVVNKYDTLFNRLHHPRAGLDVNKDVVRKQIVCALKSIVESGRFEFVLKQLSPHEIFFDGAGVVAVSLKQHPQPEQGDEKEAWKRHLIQEQELQMEHASNYQEMVEQNEKNEEGGLKEGGMGKKSERVVIEGDRWKAPEVVMGKKGINSESAAVFSLGLILWELETHQVPFRELDALNAHLQLKTGQPLPMEGIESPELVEMITQCLDLEPANRPTLSELEKFLGAPSLHKPSQPLALNPVALVETFKSD